MKLVIVLCIFIGHVYSAPSPCIELCGQVDKVNTKTSGLSQTYLTHSLLSNQDTIRDLQQSLIDQLHKTHQVNLESTRPGNWTEHNDYATDNGAGSVHEERGQLVNGGSQVRYYKKNYSASYGTDQSVVNNGGASLLTSDDLNFHNKIDRTNIQTYEQPSYYNKHNSQVINHSLRTSSNDNLARLENFGEQTDAQIHENSNSGVVSNNNDNWTRHNSFVTDGGHGKVYEEEGQYHQGPSKVRYYKKNYTSSFSTNGGDGSGIAMSPIVTLPNVNSHIDAQMNQMRSELGRVNSNIDQQTRHLSTIIDHSNPYRATDVNAQYDYHNRNHISTNQHVPLVNHGGVTRDTSYDKLSTQNVQGINSHNNYEPIRVLPIETQYVVPITQVQSTNSHRQIEKQIYVPTLDINSQLNSHSSHQQQQQHQYQHQQRHNEDTTIRIPIYRRNDGIHITDDSSSVLQNQQLNINENRQNGNLYTQRLERIPVQPQIERHVEQHWSASEHRSHSTRPQQIIITNPQRLSDTEHLDVLGQLQYGSLTHGGFDNVNRDKTNNFIAGSSSSYHQQYETKTHRDNVHSESYRHGHQGIEECDDVTHMNYNTQHGTRYRRGADQSQFNEDLTQQNDQTLSKIELGQQHEDVNIQATQGHRDHDQHNRFDDYLQQHSGNLELESQQSTGGFEDFTQQQSGNLEISQQHQSPNGQLEFGQVGNNAHDDNSGQYRHHNLHGYADQDLAQQTTLNSEDFTQKHTGNLELDQQHQSSNGHFEYEQHRSHHNHEPHDQYRHHNSHGHADRDSSQQSTHGFEDYTQHHAGNLEIDHQHTQQNGGLELGQQTEQHGHYDQYRNHGQQQSGSLEFGQHDQQQSYSQNYEQTQGHYHDHQIQQTDYLSQQSSRNDHFGQQHTDDLTQQTGNIGDFSQQTSGNLELVQPTRINDDLSQTNQHNYGSFKPAPKPVPRTQRIGNLERGDIAVEPISSPIGVKGGNRRVTVHQNQFNSHYSSPIIEQSEGVVTLEQQIRKDESANVFQPRILEAYGGNGPYDANHNENIYINAKPNPTATLAPIIDGKESFDIREPSTNDFFEKNGEAESIKTESAIKLDQEYSTSTTTAAPGFWKRIGHKITNTYEKAKDKVTDVFG